MYARKEEEKGTREIMAEEQAPIAAEGNAPEPAPVAEIKVRRQRTSISAIERGANTHVRVLL